jgi:ribonuclease D
MADFEWIDDAAGLDALVDTLVHQPAYGIDTEFHRERTYWPQVALVQLSWRDDARTNVALVDPLAVDLAPLARLLTSDAVAVAHAADQDLEVLDRACGAIPRRLFDTQLAAGFLGHSTPSLSNLVERLLGNRLAKGDRISDWTVRPLTAAQLSYAASDVLHLLDLHDLLTAQLSKRGRLGWAEDECERLRIRPHDPQEPDTAWWRVKESRSLRGKSRGIAQELAAWRERQAQAEDRPPRYVLPDLALLAIAHRPPATIDDLRAMRGVDGRHLKSGAARAIMGAIERGRSLPDDDIRRPPVDDFERRLRPAVTLTSAWIAQLASDLEIDAALLATRADLQEFLRGDRSARLAKGWRHVVVGDPVRQLVDGRAALAFDGSGGLRLVPVSDP